MTQRVAASTLPKYMNEDGRLTIEGKKMMDRIEDILDAHQAILDDHETRITTLEP